MGLNTYQWNLYLRAGGNAAVERFQQFLDGKWDGFPEFISFLFSAFNPDHSLSEYLYDELTDTIQDSDFMNRPIEEIGTRKEMLDSEFVNCWNEISDALFHQKGTQPSDRQIFEVFSEMVPGYSMAYYMSCPTCYVPYFFLCSHNILVNLFETFQIRLPELPSRKNFKGRVRYYFEICEALQEFREENNLSSSELCAFLYDFAPQYCGGLDWVWDEVPPPRAAFVIGCSPNTISAATSSKKQSAIAWQGNPDTQPGDIIMLYEWAPTSAFRSVWQAKSQGFVDPFEKSYRCIYIGNPVYIQPVTYRELKADPVFSNHALIKTQMMGMDGTELIPSAYRHFQEILQKKKFDISILPKLDVGFETIDAQRTICTERDVEIALLEPLLERLGWMKEQYVRQMPLRMGRGNTVYPDYAILPRFVPGHEKCHWVVEAKKSIPNSKQLMVDCGQAASYAQRLRAKGMMLVAQEGVWISEEIDDFQKTEQFTWRELENEDTFSMLFSKAGNKRRCLEKKHL